MKSLDFDDAGVTRRCGFRPKLRTQRGFKRRFSGDVGGEKPILRALSEKIRWRMKLSLGGSLRLVLFKDNKAIKDLDGQKRATDRQA
jgi:hypothetical protein